jgi:hypothetical protein
MELNAPRTSTVGIALLDAVHAVLVADKLDEDDFAFLTEPLSALLGLDLSQTYPELRSASSAVSEPLVPRVEPAAGPSEEHRSWLNSPSGRAWTRWLVESVVRVLEQVPDETRHGINVVQLGRDYIREDDRRLITDVSWNTKRHLHEAQEAATNWTDRGYMEWGAENYAEPGALQIGDPTEDPGGASRFERFARDIGLWFEDGDDASSELAIELWDVHSESLVAAAQALHGEGLLDRLVGHDVPVFLNDNLSAPEDLAELNRRANPPTFHERLDLWSQTWHPYVD